MSQPALKPVLTRIPLHRVATPVPRTLSRLEQTLTLLAETDARLRLGYALLEHDAELLTRIDVPAFLSRATAVLYDLDYATQLVLGIQAASSAHEATMRARVHELGERRTAVRRWMRRAGAPQ